MPVPSPWPRYMKPGTLAAFLDVSEPTVRALEKRGIIPRRHPILGAYDSEQVLKALTKAATGEERTDAQSATQRAIDNISSKAASRRRNGA